jgi:septal ring factor EnvC (AmiA/AmiB activator)
MKFIFFYIFLSISCFAFTQNKVELEKKRNVLLREISESESLLEKIKLNKTESLEKFNLIDRKINLRNKLIESLNVELGEVENKINDLEKVTNSLGKDVVNIKKEYAKMIYLSYLNRGELNGLIYILASKDINQAYKRLVYLKQYSDYKKKQIAIIKGVQNTLFIQISELESTKKEKAKLILSKEKENVNLKSELEERSKSVASLKRQETELGKKLKEKNRIAEKLKIEIENVLKSEIKSRTNSKKEVAIKLNNSDVALSNNFRDNKGKLPWPTDNGVVSNSFGEHQNPIYKGVKITNYGIDISTTPNSEVRSIFEGEITMVKFILGANYFVLIRHGNFISVYLNLVDVKVKIGDKVKIKQPIGKVYTDQDSKSTILHVEIWEERNNLDPEIWLKRI